MPPGRHTVVTLLLDEVAPFDFAVACAVFGIDRSELGVPWYRFLLAGLAPGPVRTSLGFTVQAGHGLPMLRRADTVFVPGGEWTEPARTEVLDSLRAAYARGARVMSVCTGAFLLAEAGLLDGRRVTTHWAYAAELARRYPRVRVDPSALYIDDGQVLTAGGTAAGIDLCLHIVRTDYGAQIANHVARRMVVAPHRDGGQAQFIDAPIAPRSAADALGAALDWALRHLHEPLDVPMLARRADCSTRHFSRLFRARFGTTPQRWLLHQRVLRARELLETTDEPIERVAHLTGFHNATVLRPHFQRAMLCSPLTYRRSFRATRDA
jgi:transcriptional regulator GlxA family with amidase domain